MARKLSKRQQTILYIAASIESMAEMTDGTLADALMRLRLIQGDAQRIQVLMTPKTTGAPDA